LSKKPVTLARFLFVVVLVSPLFGCDDLGPSEPRGPGTFNVDVVSPNGLEGSAVFEISGGTGMGVISSPGGEVFYRHGLDGAAAVVVLDAPGQLSFQIQTQDLSAVPSVSLVQIADGQDQLRSSVSGYDIVVVPVEAGGTR